MTHLAGHCGLGHAAQGYTLPFPLEHPGSCDFGKSQSHPTAAADPPAGEFEPLFEQLVTPIYTNTRETLPFTRLGSVRCFDFIFLNEVSPVYQ